jgi:hypothetical protein
MSGPLPWFLVNSNGPEFGTGVETHAAGDTLSDGESGELITHLIDFRTYLDAPVGTGHNAGGTTLATLGVDLDEVIFFMAHIQIPLNMSSWNSPK